MSEIPNKIIGYSKTPTRYRMTSITGDNFVRCGADLLLNGLKGDLKAEGQCPVCNQKITFNILGQHILDLKPKTTRIHVVEMSLASGKLGICCEDTHLFDREKCLNQWLSNYTGQPGISSTPQKYLERLKDKLQKQSQSTS